MIPNATAHTKASRYQFRGRNFGHGQIGRPPRLGAVLERLGGKPAMIVDRKTISIMKACELVGVSRRTIYNWIAGGKVEYVRTAGGSVRIFVDTLWRKPDEDLTQPTLNEPQGLG